jgi:hypothetical protein
MGMFMVIFLVVASVIFLFTGMLSSVTPRDEHVIWLMNPSYCISWHTLKSQICVDNVSEIRFLTPFYDLVLNHNWSVKTVLCTVAGFFFLVNPFGCGKGKAVPLQAWSDPEVSRKLRFPDLWQQHRMMVRLSASRTGRLYPPSKCSWYSFLLSSW